MRQTEVPRSLAPAGKPTPALARLPHLMTAWPAVFIFKLAVLCAIRNGNVHVYVLECACVGMTNICTHTHPGKHTHTTTDSLLVLRISQILLHTFVRYCNLMCPVPAPFLSPAPAPACHLRSVCGFMLYA